MNTLFVLLFLVSLIGLVVGLIKPSLTKIASTRKKVLLIFGGLTLLSFMLIGSTSKDKFNEGLETGKQISSSSPETQAEDKSKVNYSVASHEDVGNVENYWLLIETQDKSKVNLERFAKDFKKDKCKKDCNVSLYDDKKAVDLDIEYYQKLTTIEAQNEWKKKNYVYVADHLLGYLMFGKDPYYSEYPYRDWYYKELKGQ